MKKAIMIIYGAYLGFILAVCGIFWTSWKFYAIFIPSVLVVTLFKQWGEEEK